LKHYKKDESIYVLETSIKQCKSGTRARNLSAHCNVHKSTDKDFIYHNQTAAVIQITSPNWTYLHNVLPIPRR